MKVNEQLAQLLGLGSTAEWPHSEQSLIEMINLQREKEITKQQYYKLENTNKSIELLNLSLQSQIPSYLIPIIFSGDTLSEDLIQKLAISQQHQQQLLVQSIPQRNTPIQTSPTRTLYANFQGQSGPQPNPQQHHGQPGSSNLGPPVTFHRPLSPAKIGAAAVAQLDRGRYPTSPIHKRNQSMPVHSNTPSLNSTPIPIVQVNNSPSLRQVPTNNNNVKVSTNGNASTPQNQQSMMGTMSSIQFINENPGKKRRRASLDMREQSGEDQSIMEEENEVEPEKTYTPKFPRRKTHTRTRSENFLWDKNRNPTPDIKKSTTTTTTTNSSSEEPKDETTDTPKQGPKFANNILSSA